MRTKLLLIAALAGGFPAVAIVPAAIAQATAPAPREIAYGADPLQKLEVYPARARGAPLVIFVHGGGWKRGDMGNATGASKVQHFTGRGYAFATVNYRLVPAASVEEQAADVAGAIAALLSRARELGFDPAKVILMGHSAGAHLAALVATDPRYLAKTGIGLDRLAGVVLLDGAAYDVPAQMAEAGRFMHGTYEQAFGTDPARQRALSPTLQAAAPNARDFLILHVERDDGTRQSEALGRALQAAGARVTVQGLPGRGLRGHMAINRQLGDPDYPATAIVDGWIDTVVGAR
ncbi:alpha/beta hydrolase [Sphingomonas sp. MMS12-HWE2-04]|uniref:alpha/beta hydrolase n=1 Tax=Sphingomonas sp. MMS12-HWE2-04 TaxID=3234199 RepID=UPI00385175C5